MNKKIYNEPMVEMINLEVEDVICTSAGDNDSPWGLSTADVTID